MTAGAPPRRILLLGRGRMGTLSSHWPPNTGSRSPATSTSTTSAGEWPDADVAIDFSIPDAVPVNFPRLAERG